MAPVKFGLFKTRSRDQEQQPSTENLIQSTGSIDTIATPGTPVASTSRMTMDDLHQIDIETISLHNAEITVTKSSQKATPIRQPSCSKDDSQVNYQQLTNDPSADATSTTTLHQQEDLDEIINLDELDLMNGQIDPNDDDASTSCDVNSLQFDDIVSIAPSEDVEIHCGHIRRPKKGRSREEQQIRDFGMWQASNIEVMQNLLSRSCTLDDQIKWEAIATSRGLCTLTDSCTCGDCVKAKYLVGVTDGDAGLGSAPLFNAISVGCSIQ